ncbi:MAG: hydroxyphenylacetyl-CoA thioesterase PaaI [Chitinophagia bacterium]
MENPTPLSAENNIRALAHIDPFSSWLQVQRLKIEPGYSRISMVVRDEMMNGFGIAHGGVTFAMADTAFGYASNGEGTITVALDVSISFPHPAYKGDVLIAEARRLSETRKTGLYLVEITNQQQQLIAVFKGTCYKTGKPHPTHPPTE